MRFFLSVSIALCVFFSSCTDSVAFYLNGEKATTGVYEISVEKGSVFDVFSVLKAKGAGEKDLTSEIELVSGTLDTSTAGRYRLKYRITRLSVVKEIELIVEVRDDPYYPTFESPRIILEGANPLFAAYPNPFSDPGAAVFDSNGRKMTADRLAVTVRRFDSGAGCFVSEETVARAGIYQIDYNGFDYSGKAAEPVSRLVFYGNAAEGRVSIFLNHYPTAVLLPPYPSDARSVHRMEAGVGRSHSETGGAVTFFESGVSESKGWGADVGVIPGLYRSQPPSFGKPGNFSVYYWYSRDGSDENIEAFAERRFELVDTTPPELILRNADATVAETADTWQEAVELSDCFYLNAGEKFVEPQGENYPAVSDNCDKDLPWSRVQTAFFRYNASDGTIDAVALFPDSAARKGDIYLLRYTVSDRSGNVKECWRKIEMLSGSPAQLLFYSGETETKAIVYACYTGAADEFVFPSVVVTDSAGDRLSENDYALSVGGTTEAGDSVSVGFPEDGNLTAALEAAGLINLRKPGQYAVDFTVLYDGMEASVRRYVSVFNYEGFGVRSDLSDDNLSSDKYRLQWTHSQKEAGYINSMILYRSDKRLGADWERVGFVSENEYITVPYGISFYKLIPARSNENGETVASVGDYPEDQIIQLCRPFPAADGFTASDRVYTDRIEFSWTAAVNADFYRLYASRSSSSFSLTDETLLAENLTENAYTLRDGQPLKTAYTWYFQLETIADKQARGWKSGFDDVYGAEVPSLQTAKDSGMRDLTDQEWLRDVLVEIGHLQSRFNLGEGDLEAFVNQKNYFSGQTAGSFYYRIWDDSWPESDWLTSNRATLLDYFHFNNEGERLKLTGGIAYLYLFTKSNNDYYVGITAEADSASAPEGIKRQTPLTVGGDYPGTVDIHGILENCWYYASLNDTVTVTNTLGESFQFSGNRWVGDCDGRSGVGHSCPSYRFSEETWRDRLGFYENGTTFSHRNSMFEYTRDGGEKRKCGYISVP